MIGKYKLRNTGEIVSVIDYNADSLSKLRGERDTVSYIDSKGDEYPNMKMNIFWDFEKINENTEPNKLNDVYWVNKEIDLSIELFLLMMKEKSIYNDMINIAMGDAINYAKATVSVLKNTYNEI